MCTIKTFSLRVAVASMLAIASANANGIDSYLEGIEGVSLEDVSQYLSKYEVETDVTEKEPLTKKIQPSSKVTPEKVDQPPLVSARALLKPFQRSKADMDNLIDSMNSESNTGLHTLYLRNIPQSSILKFNRQLLILPNETTAFFQAGQRIYSKPSIQSQSPTQFCLFSLSKTGKARKVIEERELVIREIQEHNSIFKSKVDESETLVRVSKLMLDNPDLKEIICIGSGISKPLSIGDLLGETGGLIEVKMQDYTEI